MSKPKKNYQPRHRFVPRRKPPAVPETIRRYHAYRCRDCLGTFMTVDLNEGATPGVCLCFATEGCNGTAISLWSHTEDSLSDYPLHIEFYKPANFRGLSHEMVEHVTKGGLVRRAAPNAPEWVRAKA